MLETLVDSAYEYAYPLFAIAQTRHHAVADPGNPLRQDPNTVQHIRTLSDHRSRWITAPNNDTLYSNAWIDLLHGPVTVQVETQPCGRYWSLAFMDAVGNHIAMAGQRRDGCGPVSLTLVGPGATRGSADAATVAPAHRVIQAPGRDVWLFCRWLVDGADDLPQARAMQDRLALHAPPRCPPPARVVPRDAQDPANFLDVVNEALARNPPRPDEQPLLARWASIGLRPGSVDAWGALDDDARRVWTSRIGTLVGQLRQAGQRGRRQVQGWMTSASGIGQYGQDYALRASVALGGLGALEPDEALYFVRYVDEDGAALTGARRYVLHVPPQGIPTEAFWSFTMYEPSADGRRFFVDHPAGRYAIGNRTRGLHWNDDGSLDLTLQREAPVRRPQNWLPTPLGEFQIALRAYLPRPELREGRAPMPVIRRLPG